MKANPGGEISPDEVIGRDQFIGRLWQVLERQSVVLVAERRSGKTSILKKMVAESDDEQLVLFRDVEGVSEPIEFVQLIGKDIENYLTKIKKSANRAKAFVTEVILDQFARHAELTLDALMENLAVKLQRKTPQASAIIDGDNLPLRQLIKLLQRDHYIDQDPNTAAWHFRFQLLRRWWRMELGLL